MLLVAAAATGACGNVSRNGGSDTNPQGAGGGVAGSADGPALGGAGATAGTSYAGSSSNAGTSVGGASGGSTQATEGGQAGAGDAAGGAGGDGGAGGTSDDVVCTGDRQINNAILYESFRAEHCRELTGELQFLKTTTLETSPPLQGLTKVGYLRFHGNQGLTSMALLPDLASVDHDVIIYANPDLKSLAGLDKLTHVGGTFQLNQSNSSLTSLQGLASLETVDGSMLLGAPLESLAGLHLKKVGQSLTVAGSNAKSLIGLNELTSVGGDLEIQGYALTNLDGLQQLVTVGSNVSIHDSPALTNLHGLENLTSVGGALSISGNMMLASLSALDSWPATAIAGDISIKNNPVLPQCQVDAFDTAQLNATCVGCTGNQAACN